MNTFDSVTQRCVAQEGSTKDALNAMKSDNFKEAIKLMKIGKVNKDISKFKKAKELLKSVRKEISSTHSWPISQFVGNSILGVVYAWNTTENAIDSDVLYPDKVSVARMNQYTDAVIYAIQAIPGIGEIARLASWISRMSRYFSNKDHNRKESAKYFNAVCSRMIQICDLYMDSCDKYISDIETGVM